MLRKVINEFNIDTYGWFDEDVPTGVDAAEQMNFSNIIKPASDVWSLWIKHPTEFHFVEEGQATCDSLVSIAESAQKLLLALAAHSPNNPQTPEYQTEIINKVLYYHDFGHHVYSPSCLYNYSNSFNPDQHTRRISLPNYLVNPKHATTINDNYLLSDAITGIGLEALETHSKILPPLRLCGLNLLNRLNTDRKETIIGTPPTRSSRAVIADCTLDIWWALQIRSVRSDILALWPGWADIFTAQDAVLLPAVESMQSFVSKKSIHRSALRRFCMVLAWNINPHNQRLKFPPHTEDAYNRAVSLWSNVTSAKPDNGDQLQAVLTFVHQLADLLDCIEEVPSKSIQQSGSNLNTLTNSPPKSRSMMRSTKRWENTTVTQRTTQDEESTILHPGVIYPPSNWTNLDGYSLKYRAQSIKFQAKYRKAIADQISASAWFVPNPPPLEHGNLDGVLDEGNLLRYAAFSDPNIFSVRPESGAGQIAIGVLVDSSGSMSSTPPDIDPNDACAMQVAMCFLGGMRDGLSRNPNVSVCAFAYDSRGTMSTDNMNMLDIITRRTYIHHPQPANIRNGINVCALRRLDTEDDLLNTLPAGGTPTSAALATLDTHLASLYPEAQRVILILTDGAPCGWVQHPFIETDDAANPKHKLAVDDVEQVRKTVSAISTPIFCVGIGVGDTTLRQQYNVGHWFSVDSPLGAVKVACDLVRGIGQSMNC